MPKLRLLVALPLVLAALAAYPVGVGWQMAGTIAAPPPFSYPGEPADFGLAPEAVAIHTPRLDKPLSGWFFPCPEARGKAVLFLHGWRSHKHHMLKEYLSWLAKRYAVLAFDHPHHGESPDGPTTLGALEQLDAAAALAELRRRGFSDIAVFGTSMGGTTAIDLAAADKGIRAVVADAAAATAEDVPVGYLESHGFFAPRFVAWTTVKLLGLRTGADLDAASAIAHIAAIAPRPLLLIHGTADHVVAPDNAERLYAAAREPKRLYWVQGADHLSENELGPHGVRPREYEREVTTFLDRAL